MFEQMKTWLVSKFRNKKSATAVAEQYASDYYRELIQSQTHLIVQLEAKLAAYEAQRSNSVLADIQQLFVNQTNKGIRKYGETVRADNLTPVEWCQHALEEHADSMVYLMALKKSLEESEADGLETS
ncbi:hypothetical protein LAV73_06690 [Lysinibacillus xylanilyticus]|uniref:hypothetical protein n=1 Tax=Lysinibacillus xylanilyticus TaxID=582475 RepID=UPI002B244544|nr:hypothetical protein [Lysinibacillus xylanilyticus]MEB2279687.1 hypothetical protein [Lysinibacillus xylanilyticus]